MTDTVEAPTRKRDVKYPMSKGELNVLDELPQTQGRLRSSPVEEALEAIKQHTEAHGRWVEIASYGNGGAATSQANELRKRHGYNPGWQGWEFATARADGTDGTPRVGLFAKFVPDGIVENGEHAHKAELAARKAKNASRRPRKPKA